MDTRKIKEISKGIIKVKNRRITVWGEYDDTSGAPGPKRLIGGNLQAGFFGEVPTSDFITGDELASLIPLYDGISQYSNEPWLKFAYMGKIEFIAKKPFRHHMIWSSVDKYAHVITGSKTLQIKGKTYKIRLMKGKTEGKQNDRGLWYGSICHNSEWNRLMLPIHENAPDNWKSPRNVESPTEDWGVDYSDEDLGTVQGGNGCFTFCQEYGETDRERLIRGGYNNISGSSTGWSSVGYAEYGWRPVLELVR